MRAGCSQRIMGKASFAHIRDGRGQIQIYVRRDVLGEEAYAAFKQMDIGDILELAGRSLKPMPERFRLRRKG